MKFCPEDFLLELDSEDSGYSQCFPLIQQFLTNGSRCTSEKA